MVRIKICGLTNRDDALAAIAAGANALGFMFYERSARRVTVREAAGIIECLPPFVARVGVFVNPRPEEVREAVAVCGLDTLQFHGEEPFDFCRQFGRSWASSSGPPVKVVKAFRLQDASGLAALGAYPVDAWLLDSYVPGQHGGTGAQFNWDLAVAAKAHGRPILLAGGLTPANVGAAIRHVRPFGVDVSSGVEAAPGRKDADKLRAFVAAVRGADE